MHIFFADGLKWKKNSWNWTYSEWRIEYNCDMAYSKYIDIKYG